MDVEGILSQFNRRSWDAIVAALVESQFLTKQEASAVLKRVKGRATEMAVLMEVTLHDRALASIDDAETQGVPVDQFKSEATARVAHRMAGTKPAMLESIVHSDLQTSYNEERIRQASADETVEYFRFTAVLDSNTTDICRSLDGTMLRTNDPFWDDHSPPLHDRCRSGLVSYDVRKATKIGISSRPERGQYVPPANGWGGKEFRYDTALAGKDHVLSAIARAKIMNPLW